MLEELQNNGIYEGNISEDVVKYWDEKYFKDITTTGRFLQSYNQYFKQLLLSDEYLNEVFVDKILDTLGQYYQYPAKLRDLHAVLTLPKSGKGVSGHAAKWHTDYENSFGLMVLVNDISTNDSHMQFASKHKYPAAQRLKSFDENNNNIKNCVGKAGTFFLFNNGHYIHRANLLNGKARKTLHAIYLPDK